MADAKKIRQVDYYTNEEIEVYDSVSKAAYDNFIDVNYLLRVMRKSGGIVERQKLKFEYV